MLGFVWMTVVVAEIYIPTFYNMQLSSVYEVSRLRYNQGSKKAYQNLQQIEGQNYFLTSGSHNTLCIFQVS